MFKNLSLIFKLRIVILTILLVCTAAPSEAKIPHIPFIKKKQKKEVTLSPKQFKFVLYNDPAGCRNVNFEGINKKRIVVSQGVVSPDFSKMVYSEEYMYPQNKQKNSSLYYINLNKKGNSNNPIEKVKSANIADRERQPIIESGMKGFDTYIFRALSVVDWSSDSNKILIKERIGEHLDGIWATNIWVYDFTEGKARNLSEIRDAVKHYWKKRDLNLNDFRWDISPLGWDLNNSDRVVVNAYGYNIGYKRFLGCWSIDYRGNRSELLSLTNENWPVGKYGLILIEAKD